MHNNGNVVLASADAGLRKHIKAILLKYDYAVVGEAEDGGSALKIIRSREPDFIILDVNLKVQDGIAVARVVGQDCTGAVVLLIDDRPHQRIGSLFKDLWVFAVLRKPFDEGELMLAMQLAEGSLSKVRMLKEEILRLKETLAGRKMVERAKGILMQTYGITEAEALRRMQRRSMSKRIPMQAVARAIIVTHDLADKKL